MTKPFMLSLVLLCLIILPSCGTKKSDTSTLQDPGPELTQAKKLSISEKLKENSHLPVEERVALYHRLKKKIRRDIILKMRTN